MAVAYALKYPGRLNKLILASPVGIPEDPYAVNAAMPEPGSSTLANEFTQDQETETTASSNSSIRESAKAPVKADNNNFLNARTKAEKAAAKNNDGASTDSATTPPPRKPMGKWFTYLWDANISPFSLVRWSGPLGPRLVSGWTSQPMRPKLYTTTRTRFSDYADQASTHWRTSSPQEHSPEVR